MFYQFSKLTDEDFHVDRNKGWMFAGGAGDLSGDSGVLMWSHITGKPLRAGGGQGSRQGCLSGHLWSPAWWEVLILPSWVNHLGSSCDDLKIVFTVIPKFLGEPHKADPWNDIQSKNEFEQDAWFTLLSVPHVIPKYSWG